MAHSPTAVAFLLLLLLFFLSPALSLTSPSLQTASASSPKNNSTSSGSSFALSTSFLSTLRSTLDEIQKLISVLSTFSDVLGGDLRLSSAVSDCLDLLDLSSDELSLTISASQPSTTSTAASAAAEGTGKRLSDLRSWLSAALGNQDTCKESLDGTSSVVGSLVGGGLQTVTSLVANGLRQVPAGSGRRRLMGKASEGFPAWLSAGDRRLLQAPAGVAADAVVAQDGSGQYTTVGAAVEAAPTESTKRYVIHVKRGVYKENVEIKKKKWNIMLVGDGMGQSIISASRNFVDGWTTYRSATFAVSGKGFIARDLTIENTAGPSKHQAVALRSDSDLSVYYRSSFLGYQDTLYAHSLRQFYRDCLITGTVDFVFGNAAAVFQNCVLLARRPLPDQKNSVTAQGRKDPNQNTGFSLQFCNVSADADLAGLTNSTASYLGRPWKEYSRTVFMQSYLGGLLRPEGWLEWNGNFALDTLYYAEYMNYGPGSGLAGRVKWPGYRVLTNSADAVNFTVGQFIDGNLWLPSTGVKYTSGLTA
ncbi:pectinesterase/pectinesterase inhibitor PPE8B [Phoenix dactylifera]|uniref:Pectinesterase n=1 Tax=Phoenix dactylifera TaxID=42345 RepID=A0A8B7CP64_PHODC|nr:pectinesterase/pectinesterase inhibitor PPE8B [Phoenix dactylifera]